MPRPQENFSKQENEKKRLKKQQEKAERREARQAANKSGQSLEDMLAYVDEFGNITNTPPDPNRKRAEVNAEDIQIGVPKQENRPADDPQRSGTVTFFNTAKGYGFIKDQRSQESIFVHANSLGGLQLSEGTKVTFEVEPGQKGPVAVRVKLATG